MDGNELKKELDILNGETTGSDEALIFFNEAIGKLTKDLKIEASYSFKTKAGALKYQLPSDLVSLVEIESSLDYTTWAGYVTFADDPGDGTTKLKYYRKATKMESLDDIPLDVDEDYHFALALYAAMKFKQSDDDEQSGEFEKQFEQAKSELIQKVGKKVIIKKVKTLFSMRGGANGY